MRNGHAARARDRCDDVVIDETSVSPLKPETSKVGVRGSHDVGFFTVSTFFNDYDDFIESLSPLGVQRLLV